MVELTVPEARVLGALMEKQVTTPDAYPLTLNALVTACNQTTNRDPVTRYDADLVETTVLVLKGKGLARVVHPGAGERATKYRQVADEVLGLDAAERALVCVLLLRGAQTAAELKARTERLHPFAGTAEVERVLQALAARPEPLVMQLERLPGQKEPRWVQLLEPGAAERAVAVAGELPGATVRTAARVEALAALEARVAALEARLDALERSQGGAAG